MKILRMMDPKRLVVVLEKENLERLVAGDPLDFDTSTYFYGPNIAVAIGYADECPDDPEEVMKHISRGFHTTATDHQKPRLINKVPGAGS